MSTRKAAAKKTNPLYEFYESSYYKTNTLLDDYYEACSAKPTLQKYADNTVFDEEKSVRWNKEEVVRRNNEYVAEVAELRTAENNAFDEFHTSCIGYIMHEAHLNSVQAEFVYDYLAMVSDRDWRSLVERVEDITDLINNINNNSTKL